MVAVAMAVLAHAGVARADDAPAAAVHASVSVLLTASDQRASVELRTLLTETKATAATRLDGALFAGLATAGLVVAAQSDAEEPAPRPVAGLSPRLLRGGGVACDVRVAF